MRNMDKALGDGGMPLLAHLGLSFDGYGDGFAEALWTPTPLACNPAGAVHGGVYGVVFDAAMNFAVNAGLESGDRAASLDISYQVIRGAEAGASLRVRADVVRLGGTVGFAEARVGDPGGDVVARAASTWSLRRKPRTEKPA